MKIRLGADTKKPEEMIDTVVSRYHFQEEDKDDLAEVLRQLRLVIAPYAEYKINQRTTGVDIIDKGTSAVVSMSLGAGVDELMSRLLKDERLQEAYMLDCLSSELLLEMYREFNTSYARFHRRYVERYVFVGGSIPLTEMTGILEYLHEGSKVKEGLGGDFGDRNNQESQDNKDVVTANEYGVLTPAKSVVFYAILSENPSTVCSGICYSCDRTECENRLDEKLQAKSNNTELNYGYQRIFGQRNNEKK